MKATELRIGNYFLVNWSNEIRCADWMDIRDIDENIITGGVSPIPLTPEVLEKCGFEKSLSSYCYGIITNDYKNRITIFNDGRVKLNTEDLSLKAEYLHQLQNLYFALTGEELDYKP